MPPGEPLRQGATPAEASRGESKPTGAPPGTVRRRASFPELLAELKRRRVFRVMAGYGIFAFAVLQVIEPIMHGAHLGDWVLTAALVALAIGFPVALILSWVFDFTAEGVVRTPSASGGPRLSRGRVAALLVGIGLLAALPGLGWYAWKGRADRGARTAPAASDAITLAVLPLANLSGDASQDFFSEGLTEEITGKLSRLRGLAVTARSSAARAAASRKGAREAGLELGVAWVVEGSVRRTGDRLRITASLVKTADERQAWSESIETRLDDLFDVQERVAGRIVEALHLKLTPDEVSELGRWGTRNVAAYDEYLRGQVLVEHFDEPRKLAAAGNHFTRALVIDPRFAPAMAGLASAEAQAYRNQDSDPLRLPRARELLERALAIDPRLTRASFTKGELLAVTFQYPEAEQAFRQVVELEPRNYQAWDYLCWSLGYQTPPRAVEAEAACRRAIELNPAYAESYYHLARALLPQGRIPEAEEALKQLTEHVPRSDLITFGQYWVQMASSRPGEALATLTGYQPFKDTALARASKSMALAMMGRREDALQALEQAIAKGYRDGAALRGSPYFAPLRADPRFARLLDSSSLGPEGATRAQPSIAVLAFDDLSEKHDQGYFADGVAEEILNALAHVEGLRVPGRTSSFWFKGKTVEPAEIGRKLAVTHLLEGSVRRAGKRVRVTAQIVNVADGGHLWSETFDRSEVDIFAVQDEVAKAVAQALRVRLMPGSGSAAEGTRTSNPEVYRLYLLGREQLRSFGRVGNRQATAAFKQAVALEPAYAPAWAGLAHANFLSWATFEGDSNVARPAALAAAERAIALAPGSADGYAVRAELRRADLDFVGAHGDIERALRLNPNHDNTLVVQARVLANEGKLAESLSVARRSVDLDPLNAEAWVRLSSVLLGMDDIPGVRAAVAKAATISGHSNPGDYFGIICELVAKNPGAALEVASRSELEWVRLTGVAMAQHSLGRAAEAQAALDALIAGHQREAAYQVAQVYAWRGERDRAFEWLERAFVVKDTGIGHLKYDPTFRPYRGDPRYVAMLRKLKLPVD